jgi:hypothetical protein
MFEVIIGSRSVNHFHEPYVKPFHSSYTDRTDLSDGESSYEPYEQYDPGGVSRYKCTLFWSAIPSQ